MAKPVKFDFSTASANDIVSAIHHKITSLNNLYSFRHRTGPNADKLYPQTLKALDIIRLQRKNARNIKKVQKLLKPYSHELANGRDVMEVIEPVLTAYRQYYASNGFGLMNDQVLLMLILEAGGRLEELTGQRLPDLITRH